MGRVRRSERRARRRPDAQRCTEGPLLDHSDRGSLHHRHPPVGSDSRTPGGKFLLVGPRWNGQKPDGFIDALRSPTNFAGVFGRSLAAHSVEAKAKARTVLNQIGMVALSKDRPGRHTFDCEASARNKVYPPGLTAEMLATDPDMLRIRPVDPTRFWDDLNRALQLNPDVSTMTRRWRRRLGH